MDNNLAGTDNCTFDLINNETAADIRRVERVWFGLDSMKRGLIDNEDLLRLARKEKPNGDTIYCFLRGLKEGVMNEGRKVYVCSNYLLTDMRRNKRDSFFLNDVLRNSKEILDSEIVLIPYHQERRDHWSILALYPRNGLIVHCDSLPHAPADRALLGIAANLIAKLTSVSGDNCGKSWGFVPLHKCCKTPVQTDSVTCGVYSCLFAYSLLHFVDISVTKNFISNLYLWIAIYAIKGSECEKRRPVSNFKILWNDVSCKPTAIAVVESLGNNLDRPFSTVFNYMSGGDGVKTEESSADSPNKSTANCYSQCTNNTMLTEFLGFCQGRAAKLCNDLSKLQRRPVEDLLRTTSERLSALATLPGPKFRHLHDHVEFPMIRSVLRKNVYSLLRVVHQVFCTTTRNEDDNNVFALKYKPKYAISNIWSMSRSLFVEPVAFAELLTYFWMWKYEENYDQATSRIYGREGQSHTVFWDELCRLRRIK